MRNRRIAASALAGAVLAWGAPLAVASCSSSSGGAPPAADAGALDAPGDARDAADAGDAPSDAPLCPPPSGVKTACDGSDPRVVFFPPVTCDPATIDAAAPPPADASASDAGDAGDAGPCEGVRPQDVSVTPKACAAFADAESRGAIATDAARAPSITEPADGDALTPDAWSIFAWNKGPSARLSPLQRVSEWLEPSAYALTPLSGDGYVIEFTQGCTEVLRAMTATTYWAPDPASWSILTATQGAVTVRVYWAKYGSDSVVAGPVASAPITITMKH